MKLTKALEILSDITKTWISNCDPDDIDAIKLGIEALKRIESYRRDKVHVANIPLKGET